MAASGVMYSMRESVADSRPMQQSGGFGGASGGGPPKEVVIRTTFPETWLFDSLEFDGR